MIFFSLAVVPSEMFDKRISVVYEPRKASVINNEVRTKSKNVSKNVTRMVIVSSLMNALLQIPHSAYYIKKNLDYNNFKYMNENFHIIVHLLLYSLPSLDIFCYYFFNRLFKKVLNRYFKNIFRRFTC